MQESIKKDDCVFEGKEWNHISDDAMELIEQLLAKDTFERIDAASAVSHPFFSKP